MVINLKKSEFVLFSKKIYESDIPFSNPKKRKNEKSYFQLLVFICYFISLAI